MSRLALLVTEYERLQAASAALDAPGAEAADRVSGRAGAWGGQDTSTRRGKAFGVAAVSFARAAAQNKAAVFWRDRGAAGCNGVPRSRK